MVHAIARHAEALERRAPVLRTSAAMQDWVNAQLAGNPRALEGVVFDGCPMDRVAFPPKTSLIGCKFLNLSFNYGNFSGCYVAEGVLFRRVTGVGMRFSKAKMFDVTIEDCAMPACDLNDADLTGGKITGSDLSNAETTGCVLDNTFIEKNNLAFWKFFEVSCHFALFRANNLRHAMFEDPADPAPVARDLNAQFHGARFRANNYTLNRNVIIPNADVFRPHAVSLDAAQSLISRLILAPAGWTEMTKLVDGSARMLSGMVEKLGLGHPQFGVSSNVMTWLAIAGISMFSEKVRDSLLGGLFVGADQTRIAIQSAIEYADDHAGLVSLVGSKHSLKALRLALMASRSSWCHDPFSVDDAFRFRPAYRIFTCPEVTVLVCRPDHLERALELLRHRSSPSISDTVLMAPNPSVLPDGIPSAIGITADHRMIASFIAPADPVGGLRAVSFFYAPDGHCTKIARHPAGDWPLGAALESASQMSAWRCSENFIAALSAIARPTQPQTKQNPISHWQTDTEPAGPEST